MTIDLVPVRLRGYAAALITAAAYFAAAVLSSEWSFAAFRHQSLILLMAGTFGMGILSIVNHPWMDALSSQHIRPEFAIGRFVRQKKMGQSRMGSRLPGLILAGGSSQWPFVADVVTDTLGVDRARAAPPLGQVVLQRRVAGGRFDRGGLAFPSTHVVASMVCAWFAGRVFFPRAWPAYALWFTAIAASTVVCGYHYPIDVLAGLLSGGLFVALAARQGAAGPA